MFRNFWVFYESFFTAKRLLPFSRLLAFVCVCVWGGLMVNFREQKTTPPPNGFPEPYELILRLPPLLTQDRFQGHKLTYVQIFKMLLSFKFSTKFFMQISTLPYFFVDKKL